MQTLRPRHQHQKSLQQLSKHGAQTGCMFSVLKATEHYVDSHQKKRRPVFNKYAAAVASFVESYIAANQIYPKISEVVQKTGGKRSTIRRILNELNLEKNAVAGKEVCVKGRDDMKVTPTINSLSECMPSNIINSKNSAWLCSEKFEQLAHEVESAQAQVEALIDSTDAETDTERIEKSAQKLEEKGFSALHDHALLTLSGQPIHSSNKAEANRSVAPLMEVLQQKSSGSSRRVHLSACGGIENDLSWEQTLRSIMPTSVDGKEDTSSGGIENDLSWDQTLRSIMPTPVDGKEDTSGLKDEQPKVNTENLGHASSSSQKCKESSRTASGFNFTIRLVPSKAKSLLSYISGANLQDALRREAEVFKDLNNIKLFRRLDKTSAYAMLQFKNNESMRKALKLKTITIVGERCSLQRVFAATNGLTREDYTKPAGLGDISVFQEVMQGMAAGSLKIKDMSSEIFHFPTYPCVEDKKSAVCMQAHTVSHPSFLQTITIQECPCNIPLESIESFFSIFGKVQTSYGASTLGTTRNTQIFVEFQNASDKEKAIKVQQFTVDGCSFALRPAPSSLVVRLKCEESGTDLKAVAKACKHYGVVERVCSKKSQTIEVRFGANEIHRSDEILKSLRGDKYFKEKWDILPSYEGYTRTDFFQACYKEKVKSMVAVLNKLIFQLTGLLAMKDDTANKLAADVGSTSEARKVV